MQRPSGSVRFFDTKSALQHLTDHVLTPPESHAWHLVWKARFTSLGNDAAALKWCAMQRASLASNLQNHTMGAGASIPEPIAPLLQTYLQTIQQQLNRAAQLGWRVKHHKQSIGLDTNGVFSATTEGSSDTIVKTAFLPGFGTAAGTRRSQADPHNPHARCHAESRMRGHGRGSRIAAGRNGIASRLAERRADKWTPDEKIYYLVFRPAIHRIRSWQPGLNHEVRPNLQDLKPVLPRMSELKLEHWKTLRQEVSA